MLSAKASTLLLACLLGVTVFYLWRVFTSPKPIKMSSDFEPVHAATPLKEGFVSVLAGKTEVKIHYREVMPVVRVPTKVDVLLLHGQRFSSKTWEDLKTIEILGHAGHRTVAVDLPGYGDSEAAAELQGVEEQSFTARATFLKSLIASLRLHTPALVSPSMSGSFSLPLLLQHPYALSAFIPVAPVNTDKFPSELYMRTRVPTLIVYGDLDTNLGVISLKNLKNLPDHEVFVLPNSRHPAYLDQPQMWHDKIQSFLTSISNKRL